MRFTYGPVRRVARGALHSWLALLILLAISLPVALPARAQSLNMVRARYKVTFTGLFAQDALAAGVAVPSGAGFSKMIGTFHNGDVSFWSEGAIASAGVQDLAESGGVTDFAAEINQAVGLRDARRPFEWVDRRIDGTRTKILYVEAPRRFPLVTLLAKIDPSPDWFVGVSGIDLRPNGEWTRELTVNLYAWDAGTEEGSDFTEDNPATGPQATISSLQGAGAFSNQPIATVTFNLSVPPIVTDATAEAGDGAITVGWTPVTTSTGYKVQWKSGSEQFDNAAADGREQLVQGRNTIQTTIQGLTNGTEYTVRVIATNPVGGGFPSSQVTATPVAPSDDIIGDNILLANVKQSPALTARLPITTTTPVYLQGFTTGSGAATVTKLVLPNVANVEPDTTVEISIHEDDGGEAGTLLYQLTRPEAVANGIDQIYTAPAGTTVSLSANTSYVLKLERVSGGFNFETTKSDSEDPETRPGWSAADICLYRYSTAQVFHNCSFSKVVRFILYGESTNTPLLSVSDSSAQEGSDVAFTVTLSEAASDTVTVEYSTSDGTATADSSAPDGQDYTAASGQTISFAAGETQQTVLVATGDDSVDEEDETFTLTLSNPSSNAAIGGTGTATGTIVNNDATSLSDATLSALSLTDSSGAAVALTPSFDSYTGVYTATVASGIGSLTAVAATSQTDATAVYVDADDTSTAGQAGYNLDVGANLVKVMVTAADGATTKIYMVNVTRAASNDATLSGLTLTDGTGSAIALTPAFASATTNYTATVSSSIETATMTATKNHSGATVRIITTNDVIAADSATVDLAFGDTLIKAMVTAEDGATAAVYHVVVTRESAAAGSDAALSALSLVDNNGAGILIGPTFDSGTGQYTALVANSVISVTATAALSDSRASLVWVGANAGSSGATGTYALVDGENVVKAMVTAEDGNTTKIYMVVLTRAAANASDDASLSAFDFEDSNGTALTLTPAFDKEVTSYTATVANGVDRVTATATAQQAGAWPLIFTVDGTNVPDSRTVRLDAGENLIKAMVTAPDATTVKTYMVTVTRGGADADSDATLSGLTLTDSEGAAVELTPAFDAATTVYSATVASGIGSLTAVAATSQTGATAVYVDADDTSTAGQAGYDLEIGANLVKVMVTAEDGVTAKIYMVNVTRAASNDATLSGLMLTDSNAAAIALTPAFASATTNYTATVASNIDPVTLTAVKGHSGATVQFIERDGTTTTAGTATVSLAAGENLVKVMVTAEDGVTAQIYMVIVTRAASNDATLSALALTDSNAAAIALTPAFASATTNYTATVASNIDPVTLTAAKNHSGATVQFIERDGTTTTAGTATVSLAAGENLVKVMVTAEDGVTAQIYMVIVTRAASNDATLSALALTDSNAAAIALTPAFASATTNYTATVASSIETVTLTATKSHSGATVQFIERDGTTTTAGTATVSLAAGENLVKVMVTAEDGVTAQIYMVIVTRAASNDATLSGLTLTDSNAAAIALTPAFASTTTNYTATVASNIDAVTLTAVKSHSGATVQFIERDGTTTTADTFTASLDSGENLVKVMVTAEDRVTAQIYIVTVTRMASNDATLSGLTLTDSNAAAIALTPAFASATTNYTADVANGINAVTLTAVMNHSGATVQFIEPNGTTTTAETVTASLDEGGNLISVVVTAEDGATTQTYQVTVNRAAGQPGPAWSATLSAGKDTAYVPAPAGFTVWGQAFGSLSNDSFTLNDRQYTVHTILDLGGGLFFNLSDELPGDFILTIGGHSFQGSASRDPETTARGRYWWPTGGLNLGSGGTLDVSLTHVAGSVPISGRGMAPPVAYSSNIPGNHEGKGNFTFRLHFTDDISISFETLRDHSLEATGGTVKKAQRAQKGSNVNWTITVKPDGDGSVTVRLPGDVDCASQGAVCTSDGRRLHNSLEITVNGPSD